MTEPGPICETLTITWRGRTETIAYEPGDTLLIAAREAGLRPPFSCLAGACATCIARITEGSATMEANSVLSPEEVAEGLVLTCQGIPTSRHISFVYEE